MIIYYCYIFIFVVKLYLYIMNVVKEMYLVFGVNWFVTF